MTTANDVVRALRTVASPERAAINRRFFKTGKGQYGEGDQFLGVTVPATRLIVREARNLPFEEVQRLLDSPLHEVRLCGLLIFVWQFTKGTDAMRERIVHEYLRRIPTSVNNWDLVDTSAPHILGAWLHNKPKQCLTTLAASTNLWERRVAIVATQYLIRKGECADTFRIADLLLTDTHDLLHKATGWMLREVGNYCGTEVLETYLATHAARMPRTMLRYAIEKLSPEKRSYYMSR